MNKLRRKSLKEAIGLLEQAQSIIECVKDEEQEAYDNLPESIRDSDRGQTMDEIIYNLEAYLDSISDMVEGISEM